MYSYLPYAATKLGVDEIFTGSLIVIGFFLWILALVATFILDVVSAALMAFNLRSATCFQ